MRKLSQVLLIFLLIITSFVDISAIENVDRSKFNYEVLDTRLKDGILTINGWGFVNDNQNLKGSSTHSFSIELVSKKGTHTYAASLSNVSLTDIMAYSGYNNCKDSDYYKNNCNYIYNNVGFSSTISVDQLEANLSYEIFLIIHTKQTNKRYRAPLYYAQNNPIKEEKNHKEFSVTSSFKEMGFSVYYHTLRTTTSPRPSDGSNQLRLMSNCSSSYLNHAFYRQGAVFNTILGKTYYKNIIPYYTIKVKDAGCADQRRRVDEGSLITAYIPSTYVNYTGKPMTLDIIQYSKPLLSASDHKIEQYSSYLPFNYASATDLQDGNITSKIELVSSNVNTSIPGLYETCYSVTNSKQLKDSKCVNVEVIKIPTRYRYINKTSLNDAALSLWSNSYLRSILNRVK